MNYYLLQSQYEIVKTSEGYSNLWFEVCRKDRFQLSFLFVSKIFTSRNRKTKQS